MSYWFRRLYKLIVGIPTSVVKDLLAPNRFQAFPGCITKSSYLIIVSTRPASFGCDTTNTSDLLIVISRSVV